MPSDLASTIEWLLLPTDDDTGWYDRVKALPAAEAVPLVAAILRDAARPYPERVQAATILGFIGSDAAVAPLVEAMGDADPVLRARAAEALGRIGTQQPAAVQALLGAMEDGDYFVRECAAKALARLKQPEALPLLAGMRDHDDVSSNRTVAAEAIDAIRGTA